MEQDRAGVPNGSSILALAPLQVSFPNAAEVVADFHRIRAELSAEDEKVARLKSAITRPFARMDTTAIAQIAGSNESRVLLVCAAITSIHDEAQKWEGMHEKYRSKEDEELLEDLKRNYGIEEPSAGSFFT